ncbi:MAG: glycerophosphodiester phosphodiesterase [Sphingomonas taxi]|uniref:glycerophosphodiester phosphodiesterase n=1 Tax=Sphingomonas taxi TaxID=1549858 RepID=A0A2W5P2Z1_9SPHN|nr:MAG: glycerophosphodiester phosphodiesterase [Sphingomonas taxi]
MTRRAALGSALALGVASSAGAAPARAKPLVFAHRGASALRPEHTLGAYARAIADGADFIEPDLVPTKDGVLVARHENNIAETTDVAAHGAFANRRATRTIDGETQTGWFTEDFTFAELKTLRAKERLGAVRPESRSYDGQFQIVSFEEIVDFTAAEAAARGRTIGLVPELKHSTYFRGVGLPVEDRFLALLAAHDYTRRAPVQVQSFEVANLRYLRTRLPRTGNVRLVQLLGAPDQRPADVAAAGDALTYGAMASPAGLREMARYADVVAPNTRALIPLGPDGRLAAPTTLVADAHAAGLQVCPWTFRPENRFLAADFRSDAGADARHDAGSIAEMRRYIALGVDALFTDDPALGRAAVDGGR